MYPSDAREAHSLAMKKRQEEQAAQRQAELIRIHEEREAKKVKQAASDAAFEAERERIRRRKEEPQTDTDTHRRVIRHQRETGISPTQEKLREADAEHAREANQRHAEYQAALQEWNAQQEPAREAQRRELAEKNAAKQQSREDFEATRARIRAQRGW